MLLFHRLLHRFFSRLRANLLTDNAEPFRRRNPRVSKTLTSRLAPAIGASLAGFALGVYPGDQLRLSVAIYTASRALEWLYNALEDEGWFKHKPSWVGSWMLFPLSIGQLLHAFVFDRDCFPTVSESPSQKCFRSSLQSIGEFGLKYTPSYVQKRPTHYPSSLAWPGPYQVLDSLAEMAQLKWPYVLSPSFAIQPLMSHSQFVSPILHPNNPAPLPATLIKISSITSPAHPSIPNLSCALLHPSTPSCFSAYVTHNLLAFPRLARFFAIVYGLFSIFRYRSFLSDPAKFTNNLAKQVLKITTVLCGAIGTSWASVCLFQNIFPRTFLPRFRIFLGGMLGGMFALVDRGARSNWLYGARTSADSLWKVGVKKRWWKAREAGDVWVFVLSLMIVNVVYELNPSAVNSGVIRKAVGFFRGEGWADKVEQAEEAQQKQVEDPAAEKYGAL